MTSEPLTDVVDLSNCDREPIHIPGSILPHGAMLVVDPASFAIVQVAGDTGNLLGVETAALIDAPLCRLLSAEQIARLRSLIDSSPLTRPRHMLDPLLRVVPERPIDASVHVSDGALVIEVEDADLGDRHVMDPLACVQDMVAALGDAADLQSYCQKAAQQVRSVCGYDRVMIYRFMADDSGWVFAEACSDELPPFLTWGGDPRKPVETGPNGDRLTPRKSFEAWTETVRGRSSPWLDSENDAAFDLRVALLEIVLRRIDAAARERLRAWEQEQLLMAELDHRVKNTLANIQALVSQTSRNAESVIDFTDGLNRRIHSMSRAHSLLTKSRWEGVSIDSVAHEELDAYRVQAGHIVIEGPAVMLTPKAALALSLGIHELATNAAKYGALSVPTGRVEVIWSLGHAEGVTLTWTEKDGPRVMPPKTRGFGSTLIQRALALETGGTSSLAFEPGGVVCSITLPAEALHLEGTAAPHADSAAPAPASSPARRPTLGHRILVVEDSALVVLVIEDILRKLGLTIVGPGSRLAEALKLARDETIHAALLDVNLNGEMSWEVAAVLRDRGIPFLFTTGYDAGTMLPTAFADEPVLNKPFKSDDLANALTAMLEL